MLKGLLHAKAMELINETISAHREELLASFQGMMWLDLISTFYVYKNSSE